MLKFILNFRTWGVLILSAPIILHYTHAYIQPWVYEYQIMQILVKITQFTEQYAYGIFAFLYVTHVILFFNNKVTYGGNKY